MKSELSRSSSNNFRVLRPEREISAVHDIQIPPRTAQPVEVTVVNFSRLEGSKHGVSVRSRAAQTGFDLDTDQGHIIPHAYFRGEPTTTVLVKNLSTRPLILPAGTDFLVPYSTYGDAFLKGDELKKLIRSGSIGIDGKKDIDWKYWREERHPNEISGIEFKINPASRTWIPPHPDNLPLSIPSGMDSREFRDELAKDLVPIPLFDQDFLCIAETSGILHLPNNITGFIDRDLEQNQTQINAPFIFGGNTKQWPVRVENEIKKGKKPPESVVIFFSKQE